MQILTEAHSYKVRANAEKKIENAIGGLERKQDFRHIIIAQPDGRFTPAVILSDADVHYTHYFVASNIAVII